MLRKSQEDVVPADIIWRRDKIGFETPRSTWITALKPLNEENEFVDRWLSELPFEDSLGDSQRSRDTQGICWRAINLKIWSAQWL